MFVEQRYKAAADTITEKPFIIVRRILTPSNAAFMQVRAYFAAFQRQKRAEYGAVSFRHSGKTGGTRSAQYAEQRVCKGVVASVGYQDKTRPYPRRLVAERFMAEVPRRGFDAAPASPRIFLYKAVRRGLYAAWYVKPVAEGCHRCGIGAAFLSAQRVVNVKRVKSEVPASAAASLAA
jgi:hypothetical protein